MGAYFSNLHIKKGGISEEDVKSCITNYLLEKGCLQTDRDTADFEVSLCTTDDSAWMSVYCASFDYKDLLSLSPRISQKSGADILSVSCFDSDYLFLHLFNAAKKSDLWLNIGESYEIKKPRRSNLSAWKSEVSDFQSFQSAAKQKYVCAEDFLRNIQSNLNVTFEQAVGCGDLERVDVLYFSAPQGEVANPTKLKITMCSNMMCEPGKRATYILNNQGGASRGLKIIFVGDYIQNDEITIDDAELTYHGTNGEWINIPITFEKCEMTDGSWTYYWEDVDFQIQEAVSPDLPPRVKMEKEDQRSFGIRYTPNGNKRKFLDIGLFFAPISNVEKGNCFWRAWAGYPSKKAFLDEYNQSAREMAENWGAPMNLIDPDEYDLD